MLKNDYLCWCPEYKTTSLSKATRIQLRISDVCCSSSSWADENVEKRFINKDRQHLINDICNILDLSYGTCWCNCCKICALSAELPPEMKLSSVCKLLQGQAKEDRNVLSKPHNSENPVKVMQDHWYCGVWGCIRGGMDSITKWELQRCLQQ